MSEFEINLRQARGEIEAYQNITRDLGKAQNDLNRLRRSLDFDVAQRKRIWKRLETQENEIKQEQRMIKQVASSLLEIMRCYETTETNLCGVDKKAEPLFRVEDPILPPTVGPGGQKKSDFDWREIIEAFGSAGSIFGIVNNVFEAKSWTDWGKVGINVTKTVSSIAKDYNGYNKIGRAIGTANADGYFWRNFFGFNKVGHASTASSASARFYNNLHNTTSPYKLSGIFDSFAGKNGVVSSVASWAGVALCGFANWQDNVEEQGESNGTMSNGRVAAETISETVIDTAMAAVASSVIGAAIAAVTGTVAAPVVVAVAAGVAVWGINAGCEAAFGVSAKEAISDFVLDSASAVGNAVADGAKAVADWFGKLSFA